MPTRKVPRPYVVMLAKIERRGGSIHHSLLVGAFEQQAVKLLIKNGMLRQEGQEYLMTALGRKVAETYEPPTPPEEIPEEIP